MAQIVGKTKDGKDIYGVDFDIEVKECKQTEGGKRVVSVVASTPSVDRDGDTIDQMGWELKSYKKNPAVMWAHDHTIPNLASATKFGKNKEALSFEEIDFGTEGIHRWSDMIYALVEDGRIRMVSVGFIPLKMEKREREDGEPDLGYYPTHFKKQELLELSFVNVGSNRDALVFLQGKGFKTNEVNKLFESMMAEEKAVIPFKHYPLADEDTPWNGPREIREADVDQLRKMSTWFDSEDPDIKASYKLPHHQASDLKTVLRGVNAAMGALLGARGGVDIPDGDRRPSYNHLARHIREFGNEPPEFKAYSEAELKGIDSINEIVDELMIRGIMIDYMFF